MSLLDSIDGAVRSAFCIAGSTVEGLSGFASIISQGDEDVLETYNQAREFRRLSCDGGTPPIPPPPFEGGQCPVKYGVSYSGQGPSGTAGTLCLGNTITISSGSQYWGPIGGIEAGEQVCTGQNGTAKKYYLRCHGNAISSGRLTQSVLVPLQGAYYSAPSITNIFRVDGQADNCGSLPPEFPSNPQIPPVNVNVEISPDIFAPFTFIFAPLSFDVDGRIYAPVNISGTADIDINLDGRLVLAPDFKFELDPAPYRPLAEPDGTIPPGIPDTPVESTESVPDVEGESPDGSYLSGLLIELTTTPRSASVYKGGIYRGSCWVWQGNDNGLAMCQDGRFSLIEQFVPAPYVGCTKWRVLANHGYTVKVTPYYFEV